RVAAGKGVLTLHELRRLLGDTLFEQAMQSFGAANAGKEVTSAQFQAHVEGLAKVKLPMVRAFFHAWLEEPGLPRLHLDKAVSRADGTGYKVEGELHWDGAAPATPVEVVVETARGETTKVVVPEGGRASFMIATP